MLSKTVKTIKKSLIAVILLCTFLCSVACADTPPIVKEGITVEESSSEVRDTYSGEVRSFSKGVIFNYVYTFAKKSVSQNLPQNTVYELKSHADAVEELFCAESPLSEDDYEDLFIKLESMMDGVVSAVLALDGGEIGTNEKLALKRLFNVVTSAFGGDCAGSILYGITEYVFSFKIDRAMKRYEEYGFEYLLKEANELKEKRGILEVGIGKQNFIGVTKMAYFVGSLLFGGVLNSNFTKVFKAEELALLIKKPDFTFINITNDGWALLLGLVQDFVPNNYFSELLSLFEQNGDLNSFALQMQNVVSLIISAQNAVCASGVESLISGNINGFITSIFSKFGEAEWQKLASFTSLDLDGEEYDNIMLTHFGVEYETYKNSIVKISTSDLKQALSRDSEEFINMLIGFFRGICPAFFYGV